MLRPKHFNPPIYHLFPTLLTVKSANPTAVHANKKLMHHMIEPQRIELSKFKEAFQSWKLLELLRMDKPERTLKEDQRRQPSAKLTTLKVVLVLPLNVSTLLSALQETSVLMETK